MSALLGGVRALSEGQRTNSMGRVMWGAPRVSRDAPWQADPPELLALSGKVSLCCSPVVTKAAGSVRRSVVTGYKRAGSATRPAAEFGA